MATIDVDGVSLGVESFGDASAPLILCVGGVTMMSWPEALCRDLARGGRHVVRCDLRDAGASVSGDPGRPGYTLRDLAADAAGLARQLHGGPVHLAGIGVGGMVAQVAALDHPESFSALTLVGTRPVAPGPVDHDLPDHEPEVMSRMFSRPMPDWTDRAAVAEYVAEGAKILRNDPAVARQVAERIWDRTQDPELRAGEAGRVQAASQVQMGSQVHMANQLGMVFSRLDCRPRWRERLSEIDVPTLVVHGLLDPFFPVGNGEALAREIPDAQLLILDQASTVIPAADIGEVAAAMLAL